MGQFVIPLRSHADKVDERRWDISTADRPWDGFIGQLIYHARSGRQLPGWSYTHRSDNRAIGKRSFSNRKLALANLALDEQDWRKRREVAPGPDDLLQPIQHPNVPPRRRGIPPQGKPTRNSLRKAQFRRWTIERRKLERVRELQVQEIVNRLQLKFHEDVPDPLEALSKLWKDFPA